MRVSSAAILTLATLAASNLTQQATATTITVPSQDQPAENSVVPVIKETPAPIKVIASPETLATQQFSQNNVVVQTGTPKKPTVTLTPTNPVNYPLSSPPVQIPSSATENNLVVTATDVQVVGATQELQQIVRQVIKTQTGGETSQSQLQRDVAAILETGLFASANVNSSTTPNGLNVVYQVQPVVVRSLQLSGAKALTYQVAQAPFQSQIGKTISPEGLKQAVQEINKWYADNGYQLAKVLSIQPNSEGILTVNVAEGVVGDIKFRFIDDDGKTIDSKGEPVKGRTQPDFLRQQLKLKPGQIFQENIVRQDVQQLYRTGLFETVKIAFEGDANKIDLIYEVKELGARAINLGGSYNADLGLLGTLSYQDQNIRGINDNLSVNVGLSRNDLQFNTKLNSPYRVSEPDRLGYTVNAFRRREVSETLDDKITLPNGDKVREGQIGTGISFQQPLDNWDTTLGFNYTRTSIRDRQGNLTPTDEQGNQLSASGTGIDDLATVSFTASQDKRDNIFNPTQGSLLSLSTEQSVPIGQGNISMNRLKANYTQYVPVKLFNTNNTQPQVFAVNFQAGTVIGDLPPYESFNLGGSNSVRGYDGGELGSGRSYVLATAEYRFPIVPVLGGVVFADFASDLGSGDTVLGDPGGVRGKPGQGFGYGAGVRIDSPLGLIRADYGINDQGESKVHLGIGQRF
ncbi:BamA/OMP85 family outer membrane protein [Nodularia sphaerocarpa]|uniref:BamA/OMP85 family outer membrane protein n=1 Tax=Nodularia sphaerocarpa TaxID=137816 RepID=UPI001EFAEECF|nr:outer membrane protein assembly factor [Nodularia sphaerocarpa]MDB9376036.1 outer membrane protein assembly factor [Nodularia sphaerocarpa CS-585]MDB9380043.1 outer membrane protein assembly factor [Nodularia sphaerocarpa CS-585A2]ULP72091.1 Outer membrane protein assembly factor BamA [Nodularia sphaerocarpa UHCC 0038]